MAEFKGFEGDMKYGAGPDAVGNAHIWGLTVTGDTVEITDFSSTGWKAFLGLLKTWSITGECYWDETDTAQAAIRAAVAGTKAAIQLLTGDGTKKYSGDIIITSWDVSAAVDGVITATFAGQGTGTLSYA